MMQAVTWHGGEVVDVSWSAATGDTAEEWTPPAQLSEAEAWREIARRIIEDEWDGLGICREFYRLENADRISYRTWERMCRRIRRHINLLPDGDKIAYVYPRGKEPEARALAALWMALEAEEEEGVSRSRWTRYAAS